MSGIYNVSGDFVADGTVRAFATPRNKPTGGIDVGMTLTYSEMFNPGSGAVIDSNANERWRFGIKNVANGSIYWVANGGNSGNISQAPAANYVVVCQSFGNQTTPPSVTPRIRFSGVLTLR